MRKNNKLGKTPPIARRSRGGAAGWRIAGARAIAFHGIDVANDVKQARGIVAHGLWKTDSFFRGKHHIKSAILASAMPELQHTPRFFCNTRRIPRLLAHEHSTTSSSFQRRWVAATAGARAASCRRSRSTAQRPPALPRATDRNRQLMPGRQCNHSDISDRLAASCAAAVCGAQAAEPSLV